MAVAKLSEMISADLIEAIRSFPAPRLIEHCGQSISVAAFEIYANCPHCGKRIKVRSFAATTEIEDVFDAVFGWMNQPENTELAKRRIAEVVADD